ncbi:MAG TPA: DUF5691 domain-containing protein [Chitinolyticbacter sp.]|nr:DUF5691 domain-containing protein [Chitinolyticbacter sp.]
MDQLTRLALVGTANTPVDAPSLPAIAALLPEGSREQRLLWAAGADALYRQAGTQAHFVLPTVAAPEETGRPLPASLYAITAELIAGRLDELQPWASTLLAECGYLLPPQALPSVLSLHHQDRRSAWLPLLGERGRWLAAQNPDWLWALQVASEPADAAELERQWQEGAPAARMAALAALRQRDPALARDWLAAALPQEKAEQRQALSAVLADGLSGDDEPLLNQLLGDRSQGVRQLAAGLLAQLPESALAARVRERVANCLQWQVPETQQGAVAKVGAWLSGKRVAPTLTATPPNELPKDWERDGIIAQPPHGTGARSWWLAQLLGLVPPATWTTPAGLTPAELLPLLNKQEWDDALLDGLARAAARFRDGEWAGALLALPALLYRDPALADALWLTLDDAQRHALISTLLQAGHLPAMARLLGCHHSPWPTTWSPLLLQALRRLDLPGLPIEQLSPALELLGLASRHACGPDIAAVIGLIEQTSAELADHGRWQFQQLRTRAERLIALARTRHTLIQETAQ